MKSSIHPTTKVKHSTGNSNMKLYSFKKIPKTEEKGYCLTFRVLFQQLGTNDIMIKYAAHNQMQEFYLPCHYEYGCEKVGNSVSYSKTYHTVFSLLKLSAHHWSFPLLALIYS